MKQQFLEDQTGTIRVTAFSNNRPIVPSDSVTITLRTPTGTDLETAASASRDATTGEMTFPITTVHTADKGLNFIAIWTYVSGGDTFIIRQLFDVVLSVLAIPIVDEDLYNELSSLREVTRQVQGTATAGAAGTLTDTGRKEEDDFWTGGFIEILTGTGLGQKRVVSDFVKSTGVISVDANWVTNPDTTSVYRIIRSYTKKIEQSFEKLETMIYNKGQRHSLIIESSQIKYPLIYLVVHFACLDLTADPEDKWERLANKYWELFQSEFNNMVVEYDADESGTIEEEEKQRNLTEIRVNRA